MIVYIYNIGVDLYNGFNGLRHRINWTYFTVLDGLAHPLYSKCLIFVRLDKVSLDFYIYQLFNSHTERLLDTVVPLNLTNVKTLV